jgi:hypothetical protein
VDLKRRFNWHKGRLNDKEDAEKEAEENGNIETRFLQTLVVIRESELSTVGDH